MIIANITKTYVSCVFKPLNSINLFQESLISSQRILKYTNLNTQRLSELL